MTIFPKKWLRITFLGVTLLFFIFKFWLLYLGDNMTFVKYIEYIPHGFTKHFMKNSFWFRKWFTTDSKRQMLGWNYFFVTHFSTCHIVHLKISCIISHSYISVKWRRPKRLLSTQGGPYPHTVPHQREALRGTEG